jgi:bifunctional DNase/RNase
MRPTIVGKAEPAERVGPVHEMRVKAVGAEPGSSRAVLLQETHGLHPLLPVWIGAAEATAIAVEQHRVPTPPRPMTHQLIAHVVASFGRRLQQVHVTALRDNIFHAELILDRDTRVSARVSDAIALALHLGIPIHAEGTVLDPAAVTNPATHRGATTANPTKSSSFAGSSTPPPPSTSTPTVGCRAFLAGSEDCPREGLPGPLRPIAGEQTVAEPAGDLVPGMQTNGLWGT